MSAQAVREFINRHIPSATGLAALAAAIDAQVNDAPLDSALAARIQELLGALGAGDALASLSAQEGRTFLAEIRHHLAFDGQLLYSDTRGINWSCPDDKVLQAVGDFARDHAHALTQNVVPALAGLSERFGAPGAAFLDIGVGVAGLAIEMAELWPNIRIVGIDVWQPSLRLARKNVNAVGLRERIELREQSADKLEDDNAFDLAWVPMIFMPEQVLPATTERVLRALRPGGWVVFALANFGALDKTSAAFWRLRTTTWGGPLWAPDDVEKLMRDHGFVETRTLPAPHGVPVALVVGRRKPA